MNADGTPATEPRLINTLELVVSEDPDDCLGSYTSFCFALFYCPVFFLVTDSFLFFCARRENEESTGVGECSQRESCC